jgi:hypothetical protein
MKVGDLVKVKNYSSPKNKHSDRLAVVVGWHEEPHHFALHLHEGWCDIVFADTSEQTVTNISNLEVVSESQ